jgi:hypothetical protein
MSLSPHILRLFRLTTIGTLAALLLIKGVGTLLPGSEWMSWVSQRWGAQRGGQIQELHVSNRGIAVNLSHRTASDSAPAWSADGRLAWVSDRDGDPDVYLRAGTRIINLSQNDHLDFAPRWSVGGRLAWVGRDAQRDQVVYVWDGAETRSIGRSAVIQEGSLAWFATDRLGWVGLQGLESALFVWDGVETARYPFEAAPFVTMRWSADGQLAWVVRGPLDERTLYILEAGRDAPPEVLSRSAWISDTIAWSADGRLAWGEISPLNEYRIIVWEAGERSIIPVQTFVRSLAWSGDGRLVWVDAVSRSAHRITVWDGESTHVISEGMPEISAPRWSAGGHLVWAVHGRVAARLMVWDGDAMHAASSVANIVLGPLWVQGAP